MRRAAVLLAILATTACHSGPRPVPPNPGRDRLADLARATAEGTYDATYAFVQRETGTTGTIRIRQRPPRYRLDISLGAKKAAFFALPTGIVSCTDKPKVKTCFLVARDGEPVPALFDPGVQRLFRDAVTDIAAHPADYTVVVATPSPSPSPSENLPSGECFHVVRAGTPVAGGFEDGTYCFAEQGIATVIDVASGTLTLTATGPAPDDKAFVPIATVQQLPALSPTPSKT